MAPGKLITRVIQSSNEPAAESEVINRVAVFGLCTEKMNGALQLPLVA